MKYETLSRAEENEHGITSAAEILSILKHITGNATPVELFYYGDGRNSIPTTLLRVNETGLWLEQSKDERDNKCILESDELYFVSTHLQIKVQFPANQARSEVCHGYSAFYLPLPECIYRLERRNNFRIEISTAKVLRCAIPISEKKSQHPFEVDLIDISAEGIRLSYSKRDIGLVQGSTYENCQIKLPELGTIFVTIIVRNVFSLPTQSGQAIERAGCQFINLSVESNDSLQCYINSIKPHQRPKTS